MAKPKLKQQKEEKGKGKGKGKGTREADKGKGKATFPSQKDLDYEHAGIGIAIHQKWLKILEEVKEISGRIILLKFKGAGGSITFICTYAPIAESKDKDRDIF